MKQIRDGRTKARTLAVGLALAATLGQAGVAQPIATLADGAPWKMTSANGPNGQLTMFPDGSGRMKARGLSLGMTWTMQGNRLCIKARIRGNQCADLVQIPNGFRANQDGQTVFTLSR